MKQLVVALCTSLLLLGAAPSPPPTEEPALREYNDPGMHFEAQPGWYRVPGTPAGNSGGFTPLAIYVRDRDKYEQKTLIIATEDYEGTLAGFESYVENQLRSGDEPIIVDRKVPVTMANGMPAYWMRFTRGSQAGKLYQVYQYAIFDGKRGIVASVTARLTDVSEQQAKEWLSGLRVVLYPRGR